jgi:hypothetical protein
MHRLSFTSSYVTRSATSTLLVPFLSTSTARNAKMGVTICRGGGGEWEEKITRGRGAVPGLGLAEADVIHQR